MRQYAWCYLVTLELLIVEPHPLNTQITDTF